MANAKWSLAEQGKLANATSESEYNGHTKVKSRIKMEAYRSGHNGHDWKSCSLHGLRGSNPLASAK